MADGFIPYAEEEVVFGLTVGMAAGAGEDEWHRPLGLLCCCGDMREYDQPWRTGIVRFVLFRVSRVVEDEEVCLPLFFPFDEEM